MSRLSAWACAAVLAAILAAPAWAGARNREPAQSEYDLMVSELKLTEQQQADLKAKFKARDDALAAWTAANGEKLRAAEDAAKAARGGTDEAARQKASADLKALQEQRAGAVAEAEAAILAALTPEQKIAWEGVKLFQATVGRMRKVALTEEQTAKIKIACAAAAKDLAAVQGDDRKAKQERSEVPRRLKWAIEQVILTPEQREAVVRKPAAPAPAAPAPAAAPAEAPK
ncbi:MAG: hypothetical protein FJ288_00310 [Planctomycetes bacterium]|nr:hypothetical protein [Planctomycetota bacterium]